MACEDKCFTLTWKIENINYCFQKKGAAIKSPTFVVNSTYESKWYLGLYPRDGGHANYIGLYLFKKRTDTDPVPLEISYELAFVLEDGSLQSPNYTVKNDTSEYQVVGCPEILKWEEVFISKRSAYLPQDTLTVRCRIWKCDGEIKEDVRCFAHTRIEVQKRSFVWNVKSFSTLESEKKCTYLIKSIDNGSSLMSLDLSLTGGLNSEQIIRLDMYLKNRNMMFFTLRLSIVDASGNKVECNKEEFWFDDQSKFREFKFFFTKNKLMAMRNLYLPDDILSLHWECAFSEGVTKKIVDVQYACTSSEGKLSNAQYLNNQKMVPLPYTLSYNLKSLYDEKLLCDVELKTSTATFPAHKIILSATSFVFMAMFLSDMKERRSNCVNIEDMSDDTIRRMLLYIYTERMEDATWESTSLLYAAADKYAIFSLKNICSSYLKENLSPNNACEILLLSYSHADDDLKSAVQDYIVKNGKLIANSEKWQDVMQLSPALALETLSLLYK